MQRVKTKYEVAYFQVRATEDARFEPWTALLYPTFAVIEQGLIGEGQERIQSSRLQISIPIHILLYSSRISPSLIREVPFSRVESTIQFTNFDLRMSRSESVEFQVYQALIRLAEEIEDYIRNHMEEPMTASRGNIPPLVPITDPNRIYENEVFNDAARVPNPPPLIPIVSVTLVTPTEPAVVDPTSAPTRGAATTATEARVTQQMTSARLREYRDLINAAFQPGAYFPSGSDILSDLRISGGNEADRTIPIPPIRHSPPWPDSSIFTAVDFRLSESERIRKDIERMKSKFFDADQKSSTPPSPPKPPEPPSLDGVSLF